MAKILVFESDARYRNRLRFILEGINNRVAEAESWEDVPLRLHLDKPDFIILGVHFEDKERKGGQAAGGDSGTRSWPEHLTLPPDIPVLLLFSGDPASRKPFLEHWAGPRAMNAMVQPVDPYPLLSMVKTMLTAPAEWRHGGQHAL